MRRVSDRMFVTSLATAGAQRVPLDSRELPAVTSAASRLGGRPHVANARCALRDIAYAIGSACPHRHLSSFVSSAILTVSSRQAVGGQQSWRGQRLRRLGRSFFGQRLCLRVSPLSSGREPRGEDPSASTAMDYYHLAVTPNPSLQRTTPGRSPGCGR